MVNGREYSKRVYGHLPTTDEIAFKKSTRHHNNSAIIDTDFYLFFKPK